MHVSSRMASSVLCEWWMQRRRREKKILHIFSTLFVGHVSRTYLFVDYYLFFRCLFYCVCVVPLCLFVPVSFLLTFCFFWIRNDMQRCSRRPCIERKRTGHLRGIAAGETNTTNGNCERSDARARETLKRTSEWVETDENIIIYTTRQCSCILRHAITVWTRA